MLYNEVDSHIFDALPDQDLYTKELEAALEPLCQQHYRELGRQEQTHQTTLKILVILLVFYCFFVSKAGFSALMNDQQFYTREQLEEAERT